VNDSVISDEAHLSVGSASIMLNRDIISIYLVGFLNYMNVYINNINLN